MTKDGIISSCHLSSVLSSRPVDGSKRARLWVAFFCLFSFFLSPCRIKGRGGSVGHSSISSPQPALCNVMYCVIMLSRCINLLGTLEAVVREMMAVEVMPAPLASTVIY